MSTHTDAQLIKKSKQSCEKLSENLYIIGNEPTLACYRIQEHVHKSGPMIIDKGTEMRKVSKQLQSCCHGLDYAISAVKTMDKCRVHLTNIQELITNTLFFKQQLDYEENIRIRVKAKENETSAKLRDPASNARAKFAQRLSGSFDLPSNLNFTNLANSASADLKTAISNQFGHGPSSPNARRMERADSLPQSMHGASAQQSSSPLASTAATVLSDVDDSEKKF